MDELNVASQCGNTSLQDTDINQDNVHHTTIDLKNQSTLTYTLAIALKERRNRNAEVMTKRYELKNGIILKTAAANLTYGKLATKTSTIHEFMEVIDKADVHTTLCIGVLKEGYGHVNERTGQLEAVVTTQKVKEQGYPGNHNVVARTKCYLEFKKAPGIMYFDVDAPDEGRPFYSQEAFIGILGKICSRIMGCYRIYRPSVSAGVHREDELPSDPKSYRIYICQ